VYEILSTAITTCQPFPSSAMFLDLVYRVTEALFIFRMTHASMVSVYM